MCNMDAHIVVKIFKSGTRRPTSVEFYTSPNPTVRYSDLPDGALAVIQLPVSETGIDEIVIMPDDVVFFEQEGQTIHSIRKQ